MLRVLIFLALLLSSTPVLAQGGGGSVTPEGVIVPGNCTKFGTTKFKVADAGAPCGAGAGTVSSVGLALPTSVFVISGSPVTTAGTLTGTFQMQSANTVFAGPASGGAATPAFRALVAADIPAVPPSGAAGGDLAGTYPNPTLATSISTAVAFTGLGNTTLASGSVLKVPNGTVGAPTYSFSSGATDGFYRVGTSSIGVAVGGINAFRFDGNNGLVFRSDYWPAWASDTSFSSTDIRLRRSGAGSLIFDNGGLTNLVILTVPAAATLQLGAANAASPVAQTLQSQGSRAGTDTNVAGSNLTITSGQGTGNATGSSLIFQTPAAVASGTGAQTMTTRLAIDGAGAATFAGALNVTGASSFNNGTNIFNNLSVSNTTLLGTGSWASNSSGLLVGWNAATFGWASTSSVSGASTADRTALTSPAAATFQLGAANAASPVAQTLQAQGSRAGTDTNVGGANLSISAGNGTGIGTLATLPLRSPRAVASGTGAQTITTGLTIKDGVAQLTSYTVAALPTCNAGLQGGHAFVTDALMPAFLAVIAGGGAVVTPVFCDGTNWIGG